MLCVTGIEKNLRALSRRLRRNAPFPLQEVRLDALEKDPTARNSLPVDPRKLLITCRRKKDQGFFKGPEEHRLKLMENACDLAPGWIDVEADLPETSFRKIQEACRRNRVKILRSLHLGKESGVNEIQGAFSLLARSPGDGIKLSVPVNDVADLSAFLKAPADRPAVLVATGPAGIVSRALYNRFNSAWTFIATTAADAPLPEIPDVETAALLGLPLDRAAPFFVLFGGPSIERSPGFDVYNRLFRSHGFNACYLPAVTGRVEEAFQLLKDLGLAGASVTIPHKLKAAALADELDDDARNTRSVNTLYLKEGVWRGGNTDMAAITELAGRLGGQAGHRALVLGTGGFARAGAWALADMGINVILLGRTLIEEPGPWEDCLPLSAVGEIPFHILFNATPLGCNSGNNNLIPKKLDLQGKIIIDGVLDPKATPLVQRAVAAKSRVGAGIDVWVEQGVRQLDLFQCPAATADELKKLALESAKVAPLPRVRRKSSAGNASRRKKATGTKKRCTPRGKAS
jgi:3-dehydroquinate dehydratase type I